jgi:hypothetical protein
MELEGIEDAHKLPGKLREAIEGIGLGIRRLGERLKQVKEGS